MFRVEAGDGEPISSLDSITEPPVVHRKVLTIVINIAGLQIIYMDIIVRLLRSSLF